jgi:chemotaxis receptor (MCP) glutamine deamidase CheD
VRDALAREQIPIRAAATGGSRGRSVRVRAIAPLVAVKEAGGAEVELWSGAETDSLPLAAGGEGR